ncbi:HEAT repeat domain-containing protein [Candidatus Latescibacterota bacterium]
MTMHLQPWPATVAAILLALTAGCSNQVDSNIEKLAQGGGDSEAAKMALSMARSAAVEPLIAAFGDGRYTGEARAHMADALFRLYLREKTPSILETLQAALSDDQVLVRRAVVKILGDLKTTEASGKLIGQLGQERDDDVRREILVTLGMMGQLGPNFTSATIDQRITTQKMTDEERERFVSLLMAMREQPLPEGLMTQTMEWLEAVAEEKIVKSQDLVLQADLAGSEELLLEAVQLVPDSKNANQRLGKFYFDNDEREKGLEVLQDIGHAVRVPKLSRAPVIDGKLDDSVWGEITPITDFYQNIARMRVYRIRGESEAYFGHRGGTLYLGVKGSEASTDSLVAVMTSRDENAWQDDCVELFLDANRDYKTFHQIVINSIGTAFDQHSDGESRGGNTEWNGEFEHAVHVADTYWSLELAIPMAQFGVAVPATGDVWGANIARIRIAGSEYGQWAPTYGSALRPDRFGYLVFE